MKINKSTRIILIVLTAILILITGVSIYQGMYYSDNNVAKRFLNNKQEKYNVKLPQEINVKNNEDIINNEVNNEINQVEEKNEKTIPYFRVVGQVLFLF